MKLRRFQKEFLDKALAPGIDIAALSLSQGVTGSRFLAAHILTRCLTPGDVTDTSRVKSMSALRPASNRQARFVYTLYQASTGT